MSKVDDHTVFVTWDARMKDGVWHPDDYKTFPSHIPREQVLVLTPVEAIEAVRAAVASGEGTLMQTVSPDDPPRPPEGMVEVTPELFEEFRAAAGDQSHLYEHVFKSMPREMAEWVRKLRVEQRKTWRFVADEVSTRFHFDFGSDQIAGVAICDAAASVFGEDFLAEPWN